MAAKKKILLVDDDLYIRDLYEEILKSAGYIVECAIDGEEGLQKAQVGGYNLILLDIMMPKRDGLGVLRGLVQSPPKRKNGPVVLLTNMAHDDVIEEGLKLGASSYIIKTDVDGDKLVEEVEKHIN
ncbi:MAG: response regulator [Candidatus Blackburnbacteria bacterium]|nr:response regulator [Candidatus Blackburnbacteria bacterium]